MPGQARIFTSVTVGGSYGGPVRITCSGMAGVTCGPVTVPAAVGPKTVPLVVTASAGVAVGAGMLNIVAKGDPDEVVKASVAVGAKVAPVNEPFVPIFTTQAIEETSYVYNDGKPRTWSWTTPYYDAADVIDCRFSSGGGQMPVITKRFAVEGSRVLEITFQAFANVEPGYYPFDCRLPYTITGSAFQNRQVLPAPRITSVTPSGGSQGTTFTISIDGTFSSSEPMQVEIDGPGVTVGPAPGFSDTESRLVRTVSLAANAPVGGRLLRVKAVSPDWPSTQLEAPLGPPGFVQSLESRLNICRPPHPAGRPVRIPTETQKAFHASR